MAQPVTTATTPSTPHHQRYVPALVGQQRIMIECPTWCTTDHVRESQNFLEDLSHSGGYVDLMIDGFNPTASPHDAATQLFAYACIGSDPSARTVHEREPRVIVGDSDAFSLHLDTVQADAFADSLIAFAAQIRGLARTLEGRA